MDKVMREMGQEFPHEDVTLAVYTVATPPRKIGTAHLDGRRRGDLHAAVGLRAAKYLRSSSPEKPNPSPRSWPRKSLGCRPC